MEQWFTPGGDWDVLTGPAGLHTGRQIHKLLQEIVPALPQEKLPVKK